MGKRARKALATLVFLGALVSLFASIWTGGESHASFTLSDKLGATSLVLFVLAAVLAIWASEAPDG